MRNIIFPVWFTIIIVLLAGDSDNEVYFIISKLLGILLLAPFVYLILEEKEEVR